MFFDNKNILFQIYELKNNNILLIEIIGTISGILCIWLAGREKNISYLFGIINVILFSFIFFYNQLYANLLLQLFFLIANIYGWYNWKIINEKNKKGFKKNLSIKLKIFLIILSFVFIKIISKYINSIFSFFASIIIFIINHFGYQIYLKKIQPDLFPFLDSCILVFSVIAMLLMTKKYVENWLLWILTNFISINIFLIQKMYLMSLEYLLLMLLSLHNYLLWSSNKIK